MKHDIKTDQVNRITFAVEIAALMCICKDEVKKTNIDNNNAITGLF